jgi:hypothetical protein
VYGPPLNKQQPSLVKEVSAMPNFVKDFSAMPDFWKVAFALISALILALVNSAISARAGIDEYLRAQRLELYPPLWNATAAISRWPRVDINWDALKQLHGQLRSWYYEKGGLFLSESARKRYGDVQELIETLLSHTKEPASLLAVDAYTDLMETASAMRTALAEDLDTRKRKSLLETWLRRLRHVRAKHKANERIEAATKRGAKNFTPKQGI